MDIQIENEFRDFDIFCKKSRKASLSIRPLIDKKINNEKLNLKERAEITSQEIKITGDKIKVFDRPEYFENQNNTKYLYELFKAKGYLYNTEELNKLEQAMNLYEKFTWLQIIGCNIKLLQEREKNQNSDYSNEKTNDNDINALSFEQVMIKLNDRIHLVVPPTKIENFINIATCHNWDQISETFYMGCQTNELKCVIDEFQDWNKDLIYANIGRSGLFISKKGKPIKAHCLSASSYKKLKSRADIHNIIAQYNKKY